MFRHGEVSLYYDHIVGCIVLSPLDGEYDRLCDTSMSLQHPIVLGFVQEWQRRFLASHAFCL